MNKKVLFFLITLVSVFFFASCDRNRAPDVVSSVTRNKRAVLEPLLKRIMSQAMADGMVKVAVVRNLAVGDYAQQYLESCIAEGRAMGFIVDSFVLSGDDEYCLRLINRIAAADYDGLILSLGGADFSYNSFLPPEDKKIKVVTFDNLPYRDDDPRKDVLSGVTATAQDDEGLAEISLQALIDCFASGSKNDRPPVRLISVIAGPGIPPMDIRHAVYERFIREGRIVETARITLPDFTYARSGTREALLRILAQFPPGTVDAIWAPYDEFAKGCVDALGETGRREIKLTSIDISNDDFKLMMDYSNQWIASAATDPSVAGVVNMRLLAAKLAGENTPPVYTFDARLVETSMLHHSITMANIALNIPGWPPSGGLFEFPWMTDLKDRVAGRIVTGGPGK